MTLEIGFSSYNRPVIFIHYCLYCKIMLSLFGLCNKIVVSYLSDYQVIQWLLLLTGACTLDLNRFPRGAKSSKLCNLDMLKTDGSVPQMSLFKHKRVKGWWPFAVKADSNEEMELTVSQ